MAYKATDTYDHPVSGIKDPGSDWFELPVRLPFYGCMEFKYDDWERPLFEKILEELGYKNANNAHPMYENTFTIHHISNYLCRYVWHTHNMESWIIICSFDLKVKLKGLYRGTFLTKYTI